MAPARLGVGIVTPAQVDGRGGAVIRFAIPNETKLIGSQLRVQVAMTAPCGQIGAVASAGLELTVRQSSNRVGPGPLVS